MRRMTTLLASACFFVSFFSLQAQEASSWTTLVGIYAGPNFNFHSPNFPIPPSPGTNGQTSDVPLGKLTDGATSVGLSVGGLIEHRLNNWLGLGLHLGYNGAGGAELKGTDTSQIAVFNGAIKGTTANIERVITPTLSYLDIDPYVLFPDLFVNNLYGVLGLNIGIPLSASFGGVATLKSPDPSLFKFSETGTDSFTYQKSDIPSAALRLALNLGLGYNIRVSDKMWLAPEARFSLPFTKVSSDAKFDSWKVAQLYVGLALKFDVSSSSQPTTTTPTEERAALQASMDEVGYYDETGNYNKVKVMRVEDLQYSEMYPVVPYVFFDKGGAAIKGQVTTIKRESGEYSLTNLPQDAVEINRNTLNIIGSRMKQYSNASLTIIGTNSGKDKMENRDVSKQRADAVKNYLVNTFGIDAGRITTEARDLPDKPSSSTDPDGVAENRRVEFKSNIPEILDPIIIQKDKQRIATPNLVEFRPKASSGAPITGWKLSITQAGKELRSFSKDGAPTAQRWVIRPNELAASQLPIEYTMTVTDQSGAQKEVSGTIPVDYVSSTRKSVEQLPDRTIEKFSLILFDFDKAELTPDNQRILDKVVTPSIKYNSVVKIFGYTDRIGDADYNKKLSQSRANAVKGALEGKVKAARYETAGVGEDLLLFDNEAPAGRQLSRTVQIFIETPTK